MSWPEAFFWVGCAWAMAWAVVKLVAIGSKNQVEHLKTNKEILEQLNKPMWTSIKEEK